MSEKNNYPQFIYINNLNIYSDKSSTMDIVNDALREIKDIKGITWDDSPIGEVQSDNDDSSNYKNERVYLSII